MLYIVRPKIIICKESDNKIFLILECNDGQYRSSSDNPKQCLGMNNLPSVKHFALKLFYVYFWDCFYLINLECLDSIYFFLFL